jgi:RNA recognition motif-containing protein
VKFRIFVLPCNLYPHFHQNNHSITVSPSVLPITIMDDYTVQVCNLSTKATVKDVQQFFSYSGTVKKAKLERAGQRAQVAFVTFEEPYALETAVLLNGATIVDEKVCIVRLEGSEEAINRWKMQMMKLQEEGDTHGASSFIPSGGQAVNAVTTMLSKGYTLGKDALIKANELDKKYQATTNLTSFGKFMGEKSKSALIVAGQAARSAGTTVVNSSYFTSGAMMVSGALDKAARATADLGTRGHTET